MNIIDYKNIDEWLFNYFEGNLNFEEAEKLTNFLHQNPMLKADYEAWKNSYVHEPEMVYPGAKELMKPLETATKWHKWGIIVLVGSILLILFIINLSSTKKETISMPDAILPANPENQSVRHSPCEKEMEKTDGYISDESKESKKRQPIIRKGQAIKNEDGQYAGDIFPNPMIRINTPFIILTGDQDSLEIRDASINSEQNYDTKETQLKGDKSLDSTGKGKKGPSKNRKRKKEMKIIRIQNLGF